jgi:Fic family protein
MARFEKQTWAGIYDPALPRRDRRGCEFQAYVPDELQHRDFTFLGPVAADIADAESAIRVFNASASALQDTQAIARLLLRAESVASSRIEGLEIGGRRLLHAEAAQQAGEEVRDVTAAEVLGNVEAMRYAVSELAEAPELVLDNLLEVHRKLSSGTRLAEYAGRVRDEQNWIGGSEFNPCSADFVPPIQTRVRPLLEDLLAFCNDDLLPAVAQAAIAHAQFETIHPFVDGNGRTGRALIQVLLRRRGLASNVVPPVSLVLATWSRDYVGALMGTRYDGSPDSQEAIEGINRWVELFAAACRRAVNDADAFEQRVSAIQTKWRERIGPHRRRSSVDLLVYALPGAPVVTVKSAADLIGRSIPQTNEAVQRLVAAGVLQQVGSRRWSRTFEARDVIDAFTDLERRLASPEGETRVSAPTRRVPARPTGRL